MDANKCNQLVIDFGIFDNLDLDFDTLGELLKLQKTIQTAVYGVDFAEVQQTLGSLKSFINDQDEAIRDEFRELASAVGGEAFGSAVWKKWKKDHKRAQATPFSSMSESDLLELQYELIDILHFVFNIAIAIKLDSRKIYAMYHAKNKENIDRQKRGY